MENEKKQLSEEEMEKVSGGAWISDNELTKWKFREGQEFWGSTVGNLGLTDWYGRVTIVRAFERKGEPWYEICFYDQLVGNRNDEKPEAYLTGETGQFFMD